MTGRGGLQLRTTTGSAVGPMEALAAVGIPCADGPAAMQLPSHDGETLALRTGHRTRTVPDRKALIAALRRSRGLVLLGTPGELRLQAPESVAWLPASCRWRLHSHACTAALVFLVGALPFLGAGLLVARGVLLPLGALVLLTGLVLALDGRRLRASSLAAQRTRTLFWLHFHPHPRRAALLALLIMLLAAGAQLWMQQEAGGMRPVWERLGIVYPEVRQGEVWRLVSGPFLHYSPSHFLVNLLALIVIVPLASGLVGPWCWVLLLLGSSMGSACQVAFGGALHDNLGGISPGVNALFGLVSGLAIIRPRLLPGGFGPVLLLLTLLGIAMAEVANPSAATAAHVGGLLVGLVAAGTIGACMPLQVDSSGGGERRSGCATQVEDVPGEGAS